MRKNKVKFKIAFSIIIIIILITAFLFSSLAIRRVVMDYAKEQATTILFSNANRAVGDFLAENGITYSDIVKLTRNENNNLSSLEIDIAKINELKSRITSLIGDSVARSNKYTLSIPVGTLFGNEYTLGLGPEMKFHMQMAATVITDFESNFYSTGINQVLHQILIKVKFNGKLIIPWCRTSFDLETSIIAAQTVLVGVTPEAYTNVIENYNRGEDGLVGDIFDYSAELN